MAEDQIPLWLRFARLFTKEARPSMKDAAVALLVFMFGVIAKVGTKQLTMSVSWRNFLEAQFPIVAAAMVFFIVHTIKAAQSLAREVNTEHGEVEIDPYPSLVLPEKIRIKQKKETPYFRAKIVSLAAIFIIAFGAIGVASWKANALPILFSGGDRTTNNANPTPATVTKSIKSFVIASEATLAARNDSCAGSTNRVIFCGKCLSVST